MFHVKPDFQLNIQGRLFLALIFSFITSFCFSQKESKVSAGISLDYSLMNDYNNYASTVHLNYHLYDKVRIAPSFSYYFDKGAMKMRAFSFNFHYLMPELATKISPVFKNQGICLYPLAGFFISSFSGPVRGCNSCVIMSAVSETNYTHNFGFDFGVGAEYELPTMLPLLRNMHMMFEVKYFIVDDYSRPSFTFGLLYDF